MEIPNTWTRSSINGKPDGPRPLLVFSSMTPVLASSGSVSPHRSPSESTSSSRCPSSCSTRVLIGIPSTKASLSLCLSRPAPSLCPSRDDASLVKSNHFCFATYREVHIALTSMVTVGQDEDYEESQLPKLGIETDFLSPTNFCSPCGDGSDTRNDCEVSGEEAKDVSFCGFCSVPTRLPPGRCLLVSLCRCSPRPPTLRALTYSRSSTMSSFATSTQSPRLRSSPWPCLVLF